jgi:hypothetical protein
LAPYTLLLLANSRWPTVCLRQASRIWHDQRRLDAVEQGRGLLAVAQFDCLARHACRTQQGPDAIALQRGVVVVIEIIAADHGVAHGGQAHRNGAPDETRGTGY